MVTAPAGHHCAQASSHKPNLDPSNREATVPPSVPNTTWFTLTLKACGVLVHCHLKTTRWKQRITKGNIMAQALSITQNIKNIRTKHIEFNKTTDIQYEVIIKLFSRTLNRYSDCLSSIKGKFISTSVERTFNKCSSPDTAYRH